MDKKERRELINSFKILLAADKDSIYFKTNLYKTTGKEAFDFNDDKAEMSQVYAEQVLQIIKAEKLVDRLTKLSSKVSYLTSCVVEKYINYLEMGLMVYEQGKDTAKFDKMFADLNSYVEGNFVKLQLKNPVLRAMGVKHPSFREKAISSKNSINNPEDCYAFAKEITSTLDKQKDN